MFAAVREYQRRGGTVKTHIAGPAEAVIAEIRRRQEARAAAPRAAAALQRADFEAAHALGLHDDVPREGCPICDDRRGRTGP